MNMKKTLIYTANLLAVLSSSSALAQSGPLYGCTADFEQPTEQKATIVYFGNGVGNTPKDAYLSTAYLEELYKPMLEGLGSDPGTFIFLTAYNPTEGALEDVKEVVEQRVRLGDIGTYVSFSQISGLVRSKLERTQIIARVAAMLGGLVSKIIGDRLIDSIITPDLLDFVAKQQEEFHVRILRAIADNQLSAAERRHVRLYTRDLRLGRRVFVVAHSQGNLFANIALAETAKSRPNEASSLVMVGVATPAAPGTQFRGHQTEAYYRTAHDDVVIKGMRLLGPVLDSNIDNDLSVLDSNTKSVATFLDVPIVAEVVDAVAVRDTRSNSNHSFIQDYMADGLPSRKDIDSEMKRLAAAVPFPTPTPTPESEVIENAIRLDLTDDTYSLVDSLYGQWYFSPRWRSSFPYVGVRYPYLSITREVPDGADLGTLFAAHSQPLINITRGFRSVQGVGDAYALGCNSVSPGSYNFGAYTFENPFSDSVLCAAPEEFENGYKNGYGRNPGDEQNPPPVCRDPDSARIIVTANLKLTLGDGTIVSKPVKLEVSTDSGGGPNSVYLSGIFTVQVTEKVDPITQKRFAAYSVK